ncbi:MAG: divergent polysaccharide deacetylase family protein [Rhizobiales bacterium]|nr:divergent polysaccharide deacetylase family protein [Hyphomicrobiales bacterium]
MNANLAGKASAADRHKSHSDRFRLLRIVAIAVGAVYLALTLWVVAGDNRFGGQPLARLALDPEPVAPPADLRTETAAAPASAASVDGTPETPATKPSPLDDLSPEEQALLDAANGLDNANVAANVNIVGAKSVDGNTSTKPSAPERVTGPLSDVPDPALVQQGKYGPLPVIGKDGRQPWKVYARPLQALPADTKRVALVVSGLGISESATAHAIEVLPPEVTLSFAPYGTNLQNWINRARKAGHEVLLELPMEPFGYPQNDPGPYTLLTSLSAADNNSRLEWLLSRFTGYAGVMNYQGARFTTSQSAISPVLEALHRRGLLYVDNGGSARSLAPRTAADIGMPVSAASRIIDPVQNPDVIGLSMTTLERTARQAGAAIGIASAFPITVDELTEWAKTLPDKDIALVPVSSLATTE